MYLFLIPLASVAVLDLVFGSVACPLYSYLEAVAVLERWAKREGYRVSRRSRRNFFRGPHAASWNSEVVFRVILEGQDGLGRVAWLNCGSLYWGIKDPPQVCWDDSP